MKPNILMVVIDCLRADHVYEGSKAFTPNIDALTKRGFSFLNTYASTATTTPNFAALLTGCYPFENGVRTHYGFGPSKAVETFPEILQKNGYHVYAEVTGPLGKEIGLDRGFVEYNFRDRKQTIHTTFGQTLINKFKGHYKSPWFVLLHVWTLHVPRIVTDSCRASRYGSTLYARSLASIDNYLGRLLPVVGDDTLICFTSDHGEYIADSRADNVIKSFRCGILKMYRKKFGMKRHISNYMRECWIGHGISNYNELVKIPLIFCHPSIPSGNTAVQVRQIDTVPTILEMVGLAIDKQISGRSVLPIIEGKDHAHRDAYIEAVSLKIPEQEGWLSSLCVENKYKFISPWNDKFVPELYDIQNDPNEINNIATQKTDICDKLKRQIEQMDVEKMVGEKIGAEDEKIVEDRLRQLGYLE